MGLHSRLWGEWEDISVEAYKMGTCRLWLALCHNEEVGLYFMGVEQIVANAVHKMLDHMCSISKAK